MNQSLTPCKEPLSPKYQIETSLTPKYLKGKKKSQKQSKDRNLLIGTRLNRFAFMNKISLCLCVDETSIIPSLTEDERQERILKIENHASRQIQKQFRHFLELESKIGEKSIPSPQQRREAAFKAANQQMKDELREQRQKNLDELIETEHHISRSASVVEAMTINDSNISLPLDRSQSFSGMKSSISLQEENLIDMSNNEEETIHNEEINEELDDEKDRESNFNNEEEMNIMETSDIEINKKIDSNTNILEDSFNENEDLYLPPEEFFNVTRSPKASPKKYYSQYRPPPPFYSSNSPSF